MKEMLASLLEHQTNPRLAPRRSSLSQYFDDLVRHSLVLAEDLENIPAPHRADLENVQDREQLHSLLIDYGLLTEYQVQRLDSGQQFGLILGNYRVIDRLGRGGMGVVFLAEHTRMRRQVAIKVMPFSPEHDPRSLRRFINEIRSISQLQHPNIVAAIDAGETTETDADGSILHFFVMEYIPGQDLEDYVKGQGPLPPSKACDLMHQIASALAEANRHGLVHRDIKPSNIRVTPEGQAKLLDFGLARQLTKGTTESGVLGTLNYMAPEQFQNADKVDIRADLYGLGGVLYFCLTGQPPFTSKGNPAQELMLRRDLAPPIVRARRPEISPDLDSLVQRLLTAEPTNRFATPQAVMRALLPFLKQDARFPEDAPGAFSSDTLAGLPPPAHTYQVLLVDDEPMLRYISRMMLQSEGMACDEAGCGEEALAKVGAKPYDLIVLDINMPGMTGIEVCKRIRENPPTTNLKVLLASGGGNEEIMAQMLLAGADDFVVKPFSAIQFQSRAKAVLRLKEAQDRADLLNGHLLAVNHELENSLCARDVDLVDLRAALALGLARIVERRVTLPGGHLFRMQKYARCLAEESARSATLGSQIDALFIEMLECAAPLHDIGKICLPDNILNKPGAFTPEERMVMQTHTTLGAEVLKEVARNHGSSKAFLDMSAAIVRHHHERYDGTGYPDRLTGNAIPLAARIVALIDVYDALRSPRPYKPALSHGAAVQVMLDSAGTQFDPALLHAFQHCAQQFERIFRERPE